LTEHSRVLRGVDSLRHQIDDVWSHLPVPHMDEALKHDWELAGAYGQLAGVHWKRVQITHRHLIHGEWILWLPADAQGYYLASLLDHCVDLASHPDDLEDTTFLSVVTSLKPLAYLREKYSDVQVACVVSAIRFLRDHLHLYGYLDEFGFVDKELQCRLDEALKDWTE
jgi:hypothetical protein